MRNILSLVCTVFLAAAFAAAAASNLPPLCGQAGLSWAEFTAPSSNSPGSLSTFDPTYFNSQSPNHKGTTFSVGGYYCADATIQASVYGSSYAFSATNFVLSHRGYFYAPVTATYVLTSTFADDIVFAWIGPTAYSGFTAQNANLTMNWQQTGSAQPQSFSFTATAGQYVPIRIIWGQGGGAWALTMSLTGPTPINILTSGMSTKYLVQYGCGSAAKQAPRYRPFGSE